MQAGRKHGLHSISQKKCIKIENPHPERAAQGRMEIRAPSPPLSKEALKKRATTSSNFPSAAWPSAGCLGCEYCHGRGHGECIIRDDEKEVKEEMKKGGACIVLASPIYFFSPSRPA